MNSVLLQGTTTMSVPFLTDISPRPRLLGHEMEYWTGYRQKYKDAPETAGFLSLEFGPGAWTSHTILPTSTVCMTKMTYQMHATTWQG